MELQLVHVEGSRAGFECRRIGLESLTHLRRLVELKLAAPNLLQRELDQLGEDA